MSSEILSIERNRFFHKKGGYLMRTRTFDYFALTLVIIGALNWGLIGFFQFDLVASLFGGMTGWLSRTIYAIVGICGLYCLTFYGRVYDDDSRIND